MSDDNGQHEQKSSVKLNTTARGEAQIAVAVYEGADRDELQRIRELAIEQFNETLKAVGR